MSLIFTDKCDLLIWPNSPKLSWISTVFCFMTEHTDATAVVRLSAAYCKLSATASDTDPAISKNANKIK